MLRLLPLLLCGIGVGAEGPKTPPALELVDGTRTTRRILVRDEVREYVELRLRFAAPIYALACEQKDAVYIATREQCASCPPHCVLTSLLSREPPVPFLDSESEDCICGLSFEEALLRAQSLPGVAGLGHLERRAATFSDSTIVQAYSTAVWQHPTLMGQLKCGGATSVPSAMVKRFGLNGPPLKESLWWLRRFETSFGLESIEALLANASASYDANLAVFLLPVSRTQHGRRIKFGPDLDELQGCTLELPLLTGPHGQPVAFPQLGEISAPMEPCTLEALANTRRQIEAILERVPRATTQTMRCKEDWTTSWVPGSRRRAGNQVANWSMDNSFSEDGQEDWRAKRVGFLAMRSDFSAELASTFCATYRDQMRLVAHNLRERSLSYSASDAVTGCWALMERLVAFESRSVQKMTDTCEFEPSDPKFWESPCCNPQLTRTQCCMVRNATMEERVPVGANEELLAQKCRKDRSGRGTFLKSAVAASLSWQRRLSGSAGAQSCWRALMVSEMANIDIWRTVQRCHDDVMGRYDRELRMYAGAACLVDADCFTECQKPVLRSLRTFDRRGEKGQLLGRCRVPTSSRHVYLLKCVQQRVTGEVWDTVLKEISKEVGYLPQTAGGAANALMQVGAENRVTQCLGPFSSNGMDVEQDVCLSKHFCNWNHQVSTPEECMREMLENMHFCGCEEGWCFQQSLTAGCIEATNMDTCYEARKVLLDEEMQCIADAVTPPAMERCEKITQIHEAMLQTCLVTRCNAADAGGLVMHDQRCLDSFSPTIAYCLRDCNMPSGPFPSNQRSVCYAELLPNETEVDCHALPGDTLVHYVSSDKGGDVSIDMMEHLRPKYCSVRLFYHMRDIVASRSQDRERLRLEARQALEEVRVKTEREQSEKAEYLAKLASYQANPEGEQITCDLGILDMGVEDLGRCRQRKAGCCLSPINLSHALCEPCAITNTTVCHAGDAVFARHPLGQQLVRATIESDQGNDYVVVQWGDGSSLYREIPWTSVFMNTSTANVSCISDQEGCSVHEQCRQGEYCVSCEQCLEEMGLISECSPCPVQRGSACRDYAFCQPRQDSISGECPKENAPPVCPCKEYWSVRNQYPGAPAEFQISGCFLDVVAGYRWCELDTDAPEFQVGKCGDHLIAGVDRFIYWAKCEPLACDQCHCDCTPNCRAYDIVPYQGKLPGQHVLGPLGVSPPTSTAKDAGSVGPNCSHGAGPRERGRCTFCVSCCADFCHEQATLASTDPTPMPTPVPVPNVTWEPDDLCGCVGFKEGDLVRRVSMDHTPGGPSIGATGTTMAGSDRLGILVDWSAWSDGHPGLCLMAECGTCLHSGTSRFWMACTDIEVVPDPADRRLSEDPGPGADSGKTTTKGDVFDCIATNSTGCGDSPKGWRDSVGRTCSDYARLQLCMPNGGVGPGWHYVNPTRVFQDFWNNWLSADEVCCDCGGGAACSNMPQHWVDTDGFDCDHYAEQEWCNRSGFGPAWSPSWGIFKLGLMGLDARSACCSCGGGNMLGQRESNLVLVDDQATCTTIWPGRAVYGFPPWYETNSEICPELNGVCMRKVRASVQKDGVSTSKPDNDRIWALCEELAFVTGLPDVLEDDEMQRGGRRLGVLNSAGNRILTELSRKVQEKGSGLQLSFFANYNKGMCFYRLPDPLGIFGGPRRADMSEYWLPPWQESLEDNTSGIDPYQTPSLQTLGWPEEFWAALPSDPFNVSVVEEPQDMSLNLTVALEKHQIPITTHEEFRFRLQQWQGKYEDSECDAGGDNMVKFKLDKKWQPELLGQQSLCEARRCDFDETVTNSQQCRALLGCTAHCHYCASMALSTKEQGVCYATLQSDIDRCVTELGGVVIEGVLFDHLTGISAQRKVCALPHRPLSFCTAPGEQVRYCAHFDRPHCESDPLAELLSCGLKVRRCQTQAECSIAGRCSDEDLGLNWAETGTCIVSPIEDTKVQIGCGDERDSDICFFRMDPPVGMEVRWRHGLLDLLGNESSPDTADWKVPPGYNKAERLRSFGRLNKQECDALEKKVGSPGLWVDRATDVKTCQRWRGCCLQMLGGRCTLFTGTILDSRAQDETEARQQCDDCGGHWIPVFEWEPGTWRRGQLADRGRKWYPREWGVANDWAETVDLDAVRQTLENSMEDRLGQDRLNCVRCLLEPLFAAITSVASACGDDDDPAVQAQVDERIDSITRFPLGTIEIAGGLGSIASFGSLSLAWNDGSFSTENAGSDGRVTVELAVEPLELSLGAAAPQIALPGRADTVRDRLKLYSHVPSSTTLSPIHSAGQNPITGNSGGYPEWMIDSMVAAANPELAEEDLHKADAAALLAEQLQKDMIANKARNADGRSGLPAPSRAVLTMTELEQTEPSPAGAPPPTELDLTSGSCRAVVATVHGEVVGELLGDCVQLSSSVQLDGSVEMCIPVPFGTGMLDDTPQAESAGGTVFDFARQEIVPAMYDIGPPARLWPAQAYVPGKLGETAWQWESSKTWGRLPPGFRRLTPLTQEAELRHGGLGGTRLCSRVFEAGWTYCPIVRLNTSIFFDLPEELAVDVGPLASACPALDALLQNASGRRWEEYTPVDMQVSSALGGNASSAFSPAPPPKQCPRDSCMQWSGQGFQAVPAGSAGCVITC